LASEVVPTLETRASPQNFPFALSSSISIVLHARIQVHAKRLPVNVFPESVGALLLLLKARVKKIF